jgi:hypothetical protein
MTSANRYTMKDYEEKGYDPKLYVRNEDWEPKDAPSDIETALDDFESPSASLFTRSRQHQNKTYNLSPADLHKLKQIKKDKKFMVVATDTNLGPVILKTLLYIARALDDYLLNKHNYQELTELEALTFNETMFRLIFLHWVDGRFMDTDSSLYFQRKLCGA